MKAAFMTPCVTAFQENGELDLQAQGRVYDHLINGGVDGILTLGSMGEFFALTPAQRKSLTEFSADYVRGRVRLLIGTTSMDDRETIDLSKHALRNGADAVAVISPYYLKLSPKQLFSYYDKLAGEIDGPMFLYNYPDRTVHDLPAEIMLELCQKHQNIIGIKDSAPSAEHTTEIAKLFKPELPGVEIYCGFDGFFPEVVRAGGTGAIGGLSNIVPGLCHDWVQAAIREDDAVINRITEKIRILHKLYSIEPAFSPYMKAAMIAVGVDLNPDSTFPLGKPDEKGLSLVRQILSEAGVI